MNRQILQLVKSVFSYRTLVLVMILLSAQGCQNPESSKPGTTGESMLTGKIPVPEGAVLLLKNKEGSLQEIPLKSDGSFALHVNPGVYNILTKNASGTLNLVKQSVVVEENMTVNLLEVSLIPMPRIVSVSVPQVYSDSAVVEWETDIESDGRVDYGREASYGYSTYTNTDMKKQHRSQIYGLNAGTPYHFRIVSSRHGIEEIQTFSNDYQFTTDMEK